MGRALAAIALLAGVLAGAWIAFLNSGPPLDIHVTPSRTVALPLGTALAIAFGGGAALIAVRCDRGVGEILAGAKAPARPGDDHAAHFAIDCGRVERGAQLAVHCRGEAVQGLRPVQRQRANAAGMADANEGFFHGGLLSGPGAKHLRPTGR